jgi:hypothetical protein
MVLRKTLEEEVEELVRISKEAFHSDVLVVARVTAGRLIMIHVSGIETCSPRVSCSHM